MLHVVVDQGLILAEEIKISEYGPEYTKNHDRNEQQQKFVVVFG